MEKKFPIKVKSWDNQVWEFFIHRDMNIQELKKMIEEKLHIPTSLQKIIFQGKVFENDSTFHQIKIQEDQTLLLIVREETTPDVQFPQ